MFYASNKEMERWPLCEEGLDMHKFFVDKYGPDRETPLIEVIDGFGVAAAIWCCRVHPTPRAFVMEFGVACISRVTTIFDEKSGPAAMELVNRRINGTAKSSECGREGRILREQANRLGGRQQNAGIAVADLLIAASSFSHGDWCTTMLNEALRFAISASGNPEEEALWQANEFRNRLQSMSYDGYLIHGVGRKR